MKTNYKNTISLGKQKCLQCGIEFDIFHKCNKKFCSSKCRSKSYYVFNLIDRIEISCIQCGNKYTPKKHATISKYCSPACASKYNYINNKESYIRSYEKRNATGRLKDRISKYGITVEEYNELYNKQNGLCAICNNKETSRSNSNKIKQLAVDHNHNTGRVRGLLCHHCNVFLGSAREDISVLEKSILYLKKHNG